MHKLTVKIVVAAVLVLSAAALFSGGISYRNEAEYREAHQADDEIVSVYIQNRARSSWGNPDFVSLSEYGSPFDVVISAKLPPDTKYTTAQLRDFAITDGDAVLVTINESNLKIKTFAEYGIGTKKYVKGFLFMKEAFPMTPNRISVVGRVRLLGKDCKTNIKVEKSFQLTEFRELRIGKIHRKGKKVGGNKPQQ
jgi:hypothetical protein